MYITTERQLLEYPFGQYILDFAAMRNPRNAKWVFLEMHNSLADNHLLYAQFDIPSIPDSRLTLKLRVSDFSAEAPDIEWKDVEIKGIPQF